MVRILKKKDKVKFLEYCKEFSDNNHDNYITVDRERKFLNELKIASRVFDNIMKRGDKCFIIEDNTTITGILLIVGYSDKFPRKYIKCIANSYNDYFKLFDFLLLNYEHNVFFMKIKKTNFLCRLIQKFNFRACGQRGKELLFIKSGDNYDRSN